MRNFIIGFMNLILIVLVFLVAPWTTILYFVALIKGYQF
jgi:hypothetical protein